MNLYSGHFGTKIWIPDIYTIFASFGYWSGLTFDNWYKNLYPSVFNNNVAFNINYLTFIGVCLNIVIYWFDIYLNNQYLKWLR